MILLIEHVKLCKLIPIIWSKQKIQVNGLGDAYKYVRPLTDMSHKTI